MEITDLTIDQISTEPATFSVSHEHVYLGNIVKYEGRLDWLSQPADDRFTTVWGCDDREVALQYLIDTHAESLADPETDDSL